MILLKNYILLLLAHFSKKLGRGKYFRKKMFSIITILNKNFPVDAPFCFLQVGANDGKSFDFLYSFVINRASKGIVIEPVKNYYMELCENYKDFEEIIKINKAVHSNEKSVIIYKVEENKICNYPNWVKGIASLNKENLSKFNYILDEHIIEEKVDADTLMTIIKNNGNLQFDYFQVDTEGYDYKVIEMFDFKNHKPSIVRAEFINLSKNEKTKIINKLSKSGYYVFFEQMDIIGINLYKIKL